MSVGGWRTVVGDCGGGWWMRDFSGRWWMRDCSERWWMRDCSGRWWIVGGWRMKVVVGS